MQLWKRQAAIFGLAFALVLAGGVALAAVSSMGPSTDAAAPAADEYQAPEGDGEETTTTIEEPEETTTTTIEEGDGEGEGDEEEGKEEKEEEPEEEGDHTPPGFEILEPTDGTHFNHKVVTFAGYVEPGSTITRGKYSANVDGDHWQIALVLAPGKNVVGFVATDEAGNKSDDSVTVYYDAPKDEDDDDDDGYVKFTANQKYGSCSEDPPYDVFYGNAAPGTKIFVESPYGGGSTTANSKGKWSLEVKFYEAPPGKTFEVVVESSEGDRKVFTFTNTGGGEEH